MSVSLSTHILDTGAGRPASGVPVDVYAGDELVAHGESDDDGRIVELAAGLEPGEYQLVFQPPSPLFQRIALEVTLDDGHYHVPLLVSPYSCVTYLGS